MFTAMQQLLVECLHQEPARLRVDRLAGLSPDNWRELFSLARLHRVRRLVRDRLSQTGISALVPAAEWDEFGRACRELAVSTLVQQAELSRIVRALGDAGVPVILLKGAHLRAAVYGDPALREMNDIDLLVKREHVETAASVVAACGFDALASAEVGLYVAVTHHLPRAIKAGGTGVEVHWNLTPPGEPFSIEPTGVFDRAVPLRLGRATVLALSTEDLLLHLCMHAAYLHEFEFGVRPACDVGAVIRSHGGRIDWEVFCRRAAEWKWTRGVYAILRLARDVFGADVPGPVLRDLRPGDWREELLSAITAHMFTPRVELTGLATPVATLAGSAPLGARVGYLYRRIVVPPLVLASYFSVPVDSSRWLFAWLRLRRVVSLVRLHGWTWLRLAAGRDRKLVAIAENKDQLRNWLHGRSAPPG